MPDLNASHQLDAESVVPRPGDGDLSGSLQDPTHYVRGWLARWAWFGAYFMAVRDPRLTPWASGQQARGCGSSGRR